MTHEIKWPKPSGYKNRTTYGKDGVWRTRRNHWCNGCGCPASWTEKWMERWEIETPDITAEAMDALCDLAEKDPQNHIHPFDDILKFWQCNNCNHREAQRK